MRLRGIGATEKITYVEDTLKVYIKINKIDKLIIFRNRSFK